MVKKNEPSLTDESERPVQTGVTPLEPLIELPRITMFDLGQAAHDALEAKGYKSRRGSFGKPFGVAAQAAMYPVPYELEAPTALAEDDIVVVNLFTDIGPKRARPTVPQGVPGFWATMARGSIDPRPLARHAVSEDLSRMLRHGGVLVVFVDAKETYKYVFGHLGYNAEVEGEDSTLTTWDMLPALSDPTFVHTTSDEGIVIEVDISTDLGKLLKKHIQGASFKCTIEEGHRLATENFIPLARNKFGAVVAATINAGKGVVVILPDLADKAAFVSEFISSFLPDTRPDLFPSSAGTHWLHLAPYEFKDVLDLEREIDRVKDAAEIRTKDLVEQIAAFRESMKSNYALLTATGEPLKEAVIHALRQLGFEKVVDVDQANKGQEKKGDLAEDIQIHDLNPTLLIEVKGIGGMPTDDDILAAHKYLAPRMKEWKRVNLKALCVLNHQRHLPALTRDEKILREELRINVEALEIGVMTTWDLFRLIRNMQKLGWTTKDVAPIFLHSGRIDPIPSHYEFVGTVTNFMGEIAGIRIEERQVDEGDRLAFELAVEFEEQDATGIQVDGKHVDTATIGTVFGIKTRLTKSQIFGASVFRVSPAARLT